MEYLADDYEMGERIAKAGYWVELVNEVVETTVPTYDFRGFRDHQLRWARSTGLAQAGVPGAGGYICFAVGVDDMCCERACVVELFAVECGGAGQGRGCAVGWGWHAGGWSGAARSLAGAVA